MNEVGIIGGKGAVGGALAVLLRERGRRVNLYDLPEHDALRRDVLDAIVSANAVVVNAAEVRRPGSHGANSSLGNHSVNAVLPGRLAEAAAARGHRCALIHLSHVAVFSSRRPEPGLRRPLFRERDAVFSTDPFGHTKINGEKALQTWGGDPTILRLGPLYGAGVPGEVADWLALARAGQPLEVAAGHAFTPTPLGAALAAIACLVERRPGGVWHFAAAGCAEAAEVAREILRAAGGDSELRVAGREGVPAGSLDARRIDALLDFPRPEWRAALRQYLEEAKP